MLNSIGSNTYKDALNMDLGVSQLNTCYPMTRCVDGSYIPGVTDAMAGIAMNGPLQSDTVSLSNKEKKGFLSPVAKVVLGALGLAAGGLVLKRGKDGIVNAFKSLKSKLGFWYNLFLVKV